MAQDPISGILLPTDENIGSRMKTCLSIIDSYDEIWILYFLPIYLSYGSSLGTRLGGVWGHTPPENV
jgi:hypothetical protein